MFSWLENLNENLHIKQEQDRKINKGWTLNKKRLTRTWYRIQGIYKDRVQNTRDIHGQGTEYKGYTRTGYRILGIYLDRVQNTRNIQGQGTEY